MTDYRGSTWNLNFGEIGERHQFRIGYIGQPAYEAYFEVSQASDLVVLLGQVDTLQDKDLLTGDTLQVRKIFTGFFNEIAIEPRLDQYPVQIMRLQEVDVDDLIYVINLFRDDVATSPDDWDLTKMGLVDPETGTIKNKYLPDTIKGDKGDKGYRGDKGDKGDKGDPGLQGPPGVDAVVDDAALAMYVAAVDSETGAAVDERINNRIAMVDGSHKGMGTLADWRVLYEADDLMPGLLSSWGDASGHGDDLVLETPNSPTVAPWLNGTQTVQFSSSPMIRAAIATIPQPFSIVFVGHAPSFPGWFFGADDVRVNRASASSSPPGEYRMVTTASAATIESGAADNDPHLFIAVFDGATSRFVFGANDIAGVVGPSTISNLRLGGWTSSAHYLAGSISTFGIVEEALNSVQIADLRAWAMGKYGVA